MAYRFLTEDEAVALRVPGKVIERIWSMALAEPVDEAGVQVFDLCPSGEASRLNIMHTHAGGKMRSWHPVYGRFDVKACRVLVSYENGGYVMALEGARGQAAFRPLDGRAPNSIKR